MIVLYVHVYMSAVTHVFARITVLRVEWTLWSVTVFITHTIVRLIHTLIAERE